MAVAEDLSKMVLFPFTWSIHSSCSFIEGVGDFSFPGEVLVTEISGGGTEMKC